MQPTKNYPKQDLIAIPAPVAEPRRWLNVDRAADYIGSTHWFAEELYRTEAVPATLAGKTLIFDRNDLDAWMEKHKKFRSERPEAELRGVAAVGGAA